MKTPCCKMAPSSSLSQQARRGHRSRSSAGGSINVNRELAQPLKQRRARVTSLSNAELRYLGGGIAQTALPASGSPGTRLLAWAASYLERVPLRAPGTLHRTHTLLLASG